MKLNEISVGVVDVTLIVLAHQILGQGEYGAMFSFPKVLELVLLLLKLVFVSWLGSKPMFTQSYLLILEFNPKTVQVASIWDCGPETV